MKHHYGWIPDLPDQRDKKFSRRTLMYGQTTQVEIAPSADLRAGCPPVYDQGEEGSCTANAIAAAVDYARNQQGALFMTPSRQFIYWNERVIEQSTGSDSGAMIRDGFKTINKQGVCYEATFPYSVGWQQKPWLGCYQKAVHHRTFQYLSVAQAQADMLDCLAQGFPFVFGITVYDSFESDAVNASGIVPMPAADESVLGGHALLAVGYDVPSLRILFRNSWGTGWGDQGYGTIPIQYLTDPNLADDFWTIRMEE